MNNTPSKTWDVKAPWGSLSLTSRGDPRGSPVFLAHGRQDCEASFNPLLQELPGANYVAMDMPGSGSSHPFPNDWEDRRSSDNALYDRRQSTEHRRPHLSVPDANAFSLGHRNVASFPANEALFNSTFHPINTSFHETHMNTHEDISAPYMDNMEKQAANMVNSLFDYPSSELKDNITIKQEKTEAKAQSIDEDYFDNDKEGAMNIGNSELACALNVHEEKNYNANVQDQYNMANLEEGAASNYIPGDTDNQSILLTIAVDSNSNLPSHIRPNANFQGRNSTGNNNDRRPNSIEEEYYGTPCTGRLDWNDFDQSFYGLPKHMKENYGTSRQNSRLFLEYAPQPLRILTDEDYFSTVLPRDPEGLSAFTPYQRIVKETIDIAEKLKKVNLTESVAEKLEEPNLAPKTEATKVENDHLQQPRTSKRTVIIKKLNSKEARAQRARGLFKVLPPEADPEPPDPIVVQILTAPVTRSHPLKVAKLFEKWTLANNTGAMKVLWGKQPSAFCTDYCSFCYRPPKENPDHETEVWSDEDLPAQNSNNGAGYYRNGQNGQPNNYHNRNRPPPQRYDPPSPDLFYNIHPAFIPHNIPLPSFPYPLFESSPYYFNSIPLHIRQYFRTLPAYHNETPLLYPAPNLPGSFPCGHDICERFQSSMRVQDISPYFEYDRSFPCVENQYPWVCAVSSERIRQRFIAGVKLSRLHFLAAMEVAIEHLGWDKFIFIGHSMGCEIGLFFNVIHPGRMTKMVLLDAEPSLRRLQVQDLAEYQRMNYDSYYNNYMIQNYQFKTYTISEAKQALMRARNLTEDKASIIVSKSLIRVGDDTYRFTWDRRLTLLAGLNCPNEYYFALFSKIPPTLLITASESLNGLEKYKPGTLQLLEMMGTLKNFHQVSVKGDHDVHLSHPERVAPFIIDFLKDDFGMRCKL